MTTFPKQDALANGKEVTHQNIRLNDKKLTINLVAIFIAVVSCSLTSCKKGDAEKENFYYSKSNAQVYIDIDFTSLDVLHRGRLYLPKNGSKKHPTIIMAHGFTTTISGMTADKYAEYFKEAGFAVILYDHWNLGISDGEPRQEINFWEQSRGYIDCLNFALTRPEIDAEKLALWGCSLSAEEVFLVGSVDERIKAIISVVPSLGKCNAFERL